MKSAPNATTIVGVVLRCELAADGFGGELELEVATNETVDADSDFVQPEAGKPLRVFYSDLSERADPQALVGRRVRALLTYLGGPRGGRVVVRKLTLVR